jgi:hypothetical protein
MTKLYITKKIANTTLKLGKQELPKSLSPLAFSEGWNVFKNTFDAAVAINSDIPDTTLVGAYVAKSNGTGGNAVGLINLGQYNDMAGGALPSGAYLLTIANKSLKQLPITLSYYSLPDLTGGEAGSAIWGDVQVNAGIPVKFGLQGGTIMPENNLDDTTAMGAKITGNNFELDSLSPLINKGDVGIGTLVPLDYNGNSRITDSAPDIGAFEWVP